MSFVKNILFDVGCCWKQGEDREDKTIVKGELTDSATLVADKSAETGTTSGRCELVYYSLCLLLVGTRT